MTSPSSLTNLLAQLAGLQGERQRERALPPVELWNPPHCGDIGMEIRVDGSWWHQGDPITRTAMVDLFSTILRKDEDGQTYLVTPGEKIIVHIADAHFIGTRVDRIETTLGPSIVVTTNVGDQVVISATNPLWVVTDPVTGEPRPYVLVRGRLIARLARAAFYELVEWAEACDQVLRVVSQGTWFEIGDVEGQTT
ncbi:DUF1285 domain-containing protein [Candidatus Phycosocius spiralis]|uniref:DUF1285 domain-containing protein n=1 Tax=Candidatus Phycosocius spiralis TaxID=2815099 RepID=A0ABQ4PV48_9PROT|nr:DUF1285 domain-containing protein [Candidatus Phycosocius spiralis]GIU66896.1 hypothetical protein PsB1_1050 [Candidatus Phycosocius spiralis]